MNHKRTSFNCPNCGDTMPLEFHYAKIAQCKSCGSHVFLEDDAVRLAGKQSVLSEEPSLIKMHESFSFGRNSYTPVGRIRYSYGRSFWEEWWVLDASHKGYWLSVDDGDYVLEKESTLDLPIRSHTELRLHDSVKGYQVTEIGSGECLGFEGELPEIIEVGEVHHYVHLSKENGSMMTIEFFAGAIKYYKGEWLDPYDFRKALL